jgi:hypothetical protein
MQAQVFDNLMLNEIPHVSQQMSGLKVDTIGVGITFGKF